MSPLRAALESALAENPDDLASHMAYADLLVDEGDPRGEYIQVQLALEDTGRGAKERAELKRREEQLENRHQTEWIGEAAPAFNWPRKWNLEDSASWPFGLREDPARNSPPLLFARGWIEYLDLDDFNASFAAALGRSPTIRFLRHLTIRHSELVDSGNLYLAKWPCLEHIQTFQLGHETYSIEVDPVEFASVASRLHRIEALALYARNVDSARLFALPMPRLRSLTVNHLSEYPLEILAANPTLGNLTSLECWPHALGEDDNAGYIDAAGFTALVRSPHLRSLTHLALYLTDIGDKGIAALVASGMLSRLRVLDLWNGRVSDKGARLLAASPDLRRLDRLRLARNMLTDDGIRILRATGVDVDVEEQYTATGIAHNSHLLEGNRDGDME